MKKLSIVAIFFISSITNAQNFIVAENVKDGRSRDLTTGDLICTNLSAKITVDVDHSIVNLIVDKKNASYNINERIVYGGQTVLNCSNSKQKIQLIYNDIEPTFITVSEVDSNFAFFVNITKHQNLNFRNNGTTKKKPEKIRS